MNLLKKIFSLLSRKQSSYTACTFFYDLEISFLNIQKNIFHIFLEIVFQAFKKDFWISVQICTLCE